MCRGHVSVALIKSEPGLGLTILKVSRKVSQAEVHAPEVNL